MSITLYSAVRGTNAFRESDALRRVFEGVVAMCIATGLVGGEAFSIDASLIKADVDKKMPGDQPIAWPKAEEASHAVREYLAALDAARDEDGGGDAQQRKIYICPGGA